MKKASYTHMHTYTEKEELRTRLTLPLVNSKVWPSRSDPCQTRVTPLLHHTQYKTSGKEIKVAMKVLANIFPRPVVEKKVYLNKHVRCYAINRKFGWDTLFSSVLAVRN
ncbi:hypothetical protein VNO80_19398 [Phaseolus coccineus]|uniref:Uncharacterized protein n=1 Tax=Phaseolus coccineus TaxID=3886 RepID=A0AAN9QZQ9_PHACN